MRPLDLMVGRGVGSLKGGLRERNAHATPGELEMEMRSSNKKGILCRTDTKLKLRCCSFPSLPFPSEIYNECHAMQRNEYICTVPPLPPMCIPRRHANVQRDLYLKAGFCPGGRSLGYRRA